MFCCEATHTRYYFTNDKFANIILLIGQEITI